MNSKIYSGEYLSGILYNFVPAGVLLSVHSAALAVSPAHLSVFAGQQLFDWGPALVEQDAPQTPSAPRLYKPVPAPGSDGEKMNTFSV